MPIYLDRGNVWKEGFAPIEARIFSERALAERRVQHDPSSLSWAVKTIWSVRNHIPREVDSSLGPVSKTTHLIRANHHTPDQRRKIFKKELDRMNLDRELSNILLEIFWRHWDIRYEHLKLVNGINIVKLEDWKRSREWDNVFS